MESEEVFEVLSRARRRVEAGEGVEGTGFWKAVGAARANPQIARRFASDIAEIDRRAFENSVRLRVPFAVGQFVLVAGIAVGAAAVGAAYRLEGVVRDLVFLGGVGALLICTHSPAHWLVGRLMGMRFTHYFLGGPPPPRPGAKIDYATYLQVPARKRAVMHASGALVTKVLPFALIPSAVVSGASRWVAWLLLVLGAVQIVTDVLFSTKTSDWKRARREWRISRGAAASASRRS